MSKLFGRSFTPVPKYKSVGVNRDGAFAEYLAIPATNVFRPSVYIPTDLLAIFDPYGNATHTALSFNMVGEDVVITGRAHWYYGCHGHGHCGARNVILTDVNEYRLDLAKRIVPKVKPINVSKQQITREFMEPRHTRGLRCVSRCRAHPLRSAMCWTK